MTSASSRTADPAVLPLRLLGDPVLRAKAAPVEVFDDALERFAEELIAAMYAHKGVGLAAPQVGRSTRVIAVDAGELRDGSEAFALVNPRIVQTEGRVASEEGCLSIPGITADVERSARVVVEGLTPRGEPRRVEGAELLARVLQHEIDHLDGILFVDRLGPLRRRMALRAYRRQQEEGASETGSRL
ncbi:MAG: peptide deformylase [Gemmatimonadota bacterium]